MKKLKIITSPNVEPVFKSYPRSVRNKLLNLRRLIIETANEIDDISRLEETLKWGEPSYLVKNGSTIRIDWKEKHPDHYSIYFKCTSKLVPTFKTVYGKIFNYEGDRAIIFQLDEKLPDAELKNCIRAGLTYHKVKHLPTLAL